MPLHVDTEMRRLRLRWLLAADAVERKLAQFAQHHRAALLAVALTSRPSECRHHYVASGRRSDWLLAALRVKLALMRLEELRRKAGFNPDQPRVPAGNPDGGQWTSGGGTSARIRLAAGDKPQLGRGTMATIAVQLAKRIIDANRSDNGLWDLFQSKIGTVTYTNIDGENIFGTNSTSPTYLSADLAAAERVRDALIEKYPDVMNTQNIGRRPNNAVFHAEATVLLRAANAYGGTLVGRTLEVFSDRAICDSCKVVLPLIGRELGNPTVTFVGPSGSTKTMRNGDWID
jgi:hypothetical protein